MREGDRRVWAVWGFLAGLYGGRIRGLEARGGRDGR